jgi:hypothetical protein
MGNSSHPRRYVCLTVLGLGLSAGICGLLTLGCRQDDPAPPPDPAVHGSPLYQDVTADSGVRFTYRNGQEAGHFTILEMMGGGVALLDYDGDGLLDIFIPGGGYFDGPDKQTVRGHGCRLYKNLGNWKFKDVTEEVGLDRPLFYAEGCAVADYDRDGWPDLLVTGWGRLALYHNEDDGKGGRRFREVTREAGLTDTRWSTSAAWGDLDGDGYPDLYVCHYVNWSFQNHPRCRGTTPEIPRDVCAPKQFLGVPHLLYRNNGDGTFTDVSARAGLRIDPAKKHTGKGLGVVIADFNGDRRPDIYVANDTVDNFLYLNRGGWKFEEVGLTSGVARDDNANANGSMGVDVGDYNHTGLPSIIVTTYEGEKPALYRNLGRGELFRYGTSPAGLGALGRSYVGFGTVFLDVDNDGWEDLVMVNGHAIRFPGEAGLRQHPVMLRNQGGQFEEVTLQAGPYFRGKHVGRGLAVGDLDNDGRPDLVISHLNEPVVLLRNVAGGGRPANHWLGIALKGKGHADVVGARLTLEVNGQRLTRFAKGGGSYLSASDPRHLFGLGKADRVERLTVAWPSGRTQVCQGKDLAVDRYWTLVEGEKEPEPWRGRAQHRLRP